MCVSCGRLRNRAFAAGFDTLWKCGACEIEHLRGPWLVLRSTWTMAGSEVTHCDHRCLPSGLGGVVRGSGHKQNGYRSAARKRR